MFRKILELLKMCFVIFLEFNVILDVVDKYVGFLVCKLLSGDFCFIENVVILDVFLVEDIVKVCLLFFLVEEKFLGVNVFGLNGILKDVF